MDLTRLAPRPRWRRRRLASLRGRRHYAPEVAYTDTQLEFLSAHRWAVLATGRLDGSPQQAMVGYALDDEGRVLVLTRSFTAKWRNGCGSPGCRSPFPRTPARCRLWHGGGNRHRSREGRAQRRRPGGRAGPSARAVDYRRLARREPTGGLAHHPREGADARVSAHPRRDRTRRWPAERLPPEREWLCPAELRRRSACPPSPRRDRGGGAGRRGRPLRSEGRRACRGDRAPCPWRR